jgi:hypothetical protein
MLEKIFLLEDILVFRYDIKFLIHVQVRQVYEDMFLSFYLDFFQFNSKSMLNRSIKKIF